MKLLYFVATPTYFVSHRLHLAIAALKAGYEVALVTACDNPQSSGALPTHSETQQSKITTENLPHPKENIELIQKAGIQIFPLKYFRRSSMNPWTQILSLLELYRIYRAYKPDLVHQVAFKPVLYGSLIARCLGVRKIINAFGGLGYLFIEGAESKHFIKYALKKILRPLLRWVFSAPNTVLILQNTDDQKTLIHNQWVPSEKTVIIRGAGVDLEHFRAKPFPSTPPIRIACVSRLLWFKGIGDLVEAARMLKTQAQPTSVDATSVPAQAQDTTSALAHSQDSAQYLDEHSAMLLQTAPRIPSIEIWLYGNPDPENPAAIPETQLLAWQAAGLIRWAGHCHNVAEAYAQAHIAVLVSHGGEGVPKTLLEAASCGRPIVATDVPGCRDVVQDGDNGFLVPPHAPGALAQALSRLVQDPELRERMGALGRTRVAQHFSNDIVQSQTLALYQAP